MKIERSNGAASERPVEAGFVGGIRISGYFRHDQPSRLAGATVSFAPGARTPWKTNPIGQTIVVLSGAGRVQAKGGEIVEVQTGDVISWSPEERHWEGAAPDQAMTYFACQEEDGAIVSFGDCVTDAEYKGCRGRAMEDSYPTQSQTRNGVTTGRVLTLSHSHRFSRLLGVKTSVQTSAFEIGKSPRL